MCDSITRGEQKENGLLSFEGRDARFVVVLIDQDFMHVGADVAIAQVERGNRDADFFQAAFDAGEAFLNLVEAVIHFRSQVFHIASHLAEDMKDQVFCWR
jgi:hypothetical protein